MQSFENNYISERIKYYFFRGCEYTSNFMTFVEFPYLLNHISLLVTLILE